MKAEFQPLERNQVQVAFQNRQNASQSVLELSVECRDQGQLTHFPENLVEVGDLDGVSLIFGTINEFPSSLEFSIPRDSFDSIHLTLFSILNIEDPKELQKFLSDIDDVLVSFSAVRLDAFGLHGPEKRFVLKSSSTGNTVGSFDSELVANSIKQWVSMRFKSTLELVESDLS